MARWSVTSWTSGARATSSPRASPSGALTAVGEFLLSALVTLGLFAAFSIAIWLIWSNGKAMAQGFGMALGAALLGGLGSYFSYTRSLLHKLFNGNLFQQ